MVQPNMTPPVPTSSQPLWGKAECEKTNNICSPPWSYMLKDQREKEREESAFLRQNKWYYILQNGPGDAQARGDHLLWPVSPFRAPLTPKPLGFALNFRPAL